MPAGLVLAPMDFAPEEAQGLPFVPSFALGVLITAPVLTGILIACRQAPVRLYARAAGLWGTLAGVVWNAGNVRTSMPLCFTTRLSAALMCCSVQINLGPAARNRCVTVTRAGVLNPSYNQSSSGPVRGVSHHAGVPILRHRLCSPAVAGSVGPFCDVQE